MKWWAYMFVLLKKRPLAQLSLKRTHTNTPGKLKAERGCFAAALVKSRGFNWKAKYVICVGVLWWMRNARAMREPLSGGRWIIAKDCLLIAFCCWWGREGEEILPSCTLPLNFCKAVIYSACSITPMRLETARRVKTHASFLWREKLKNYVFGYTLKCKMEWKLNC
jgi:hypothetical protein